MGLTPSRFEAGIGRLLQVLDKTLLEEQAERAAARSVGADKVLTDNPNAYAGWAAKEGCGRSR